jgi:ribonuclease T2
MLDLMPAERLIYHEWDEHGTCSGLSPEAYFDTIRKARNKVNIPPDFVGVKFVQRVSPGHVKEAFIKVECVCLRRTHGVPCEKPEGWG